MPRRTEPHPMGLMVGQRIVQLRKEQGMTLEDLALASGVAKGHLSNVEHGLAVINAATIESIARGLGLEAFYLLVFPQRNIRHQCVERLRTLNDKQLKALLAPARQPRATRPVARRRRV